MKLLKVLRCLPLLLALLLVTGLYGGVVSAEPPFNDVDLWWPCTHAKAAVCATVCPDCNAAIENTAPHTYDGGSTDPVCDLCGDTRAIAAITAQPTTGYAKMGKKVSVSVTATGDNLTYVWYFQNAGAAAFTKSSNKTATYSTTMSDTAKNRQVKCQITDAYGNTVETDTVYLREAVSVTTQPGTAYAKKNATAKVTVKASGDGLTYTWYFKNSGAAAFTKSSIKTATYSTAMSSTTKNRQVYCVVKDKYGKTVTSNTVYLREAASITTQPKTAYAKKNATAKVTVKASGDGLTYAWYFKNSGAASFTKSSIKTATYSTTLSVTTKNRQVYCVVKDKYGKTVTSNTVYLREAASITTQPKTAYAKKNATAKVTVKAAGDGLTYTWYYKNSGASKFTKASATTATYSAKITATTKNRQVYCVVKDKYGKSVTSNTVYLREAASITTQPKTVTVAKNKTAKVTVKASGDGLTYTWYYKNAGASKFTKASTKTASYSVKMTATTKGRVVYCVVKDKYGKTVTSSKATLKMK